MFRGARFDDADTLGIMRAVHDETGPLVDPTLRSGLARTGRPGAGVATVALATAHPASSRTRSRRRRAAGPELPPPLADSLERPERTTVVANDLARRRGRRRYVTAPVAR